MWPWGGTRTWAVISLGMLTAAYARHQAGGMVHPQPWPLSIFLVTVTTRLRRYAHMYVHLSLSLSFLSPRSFEARPGWHCQCSDPKPRKQTTSSCNRASVPSGRLHGRPTMRAILERWVASGEGGRLGGHSRLVWLRITFSFLYDKT